MSNPFKELLKSLGNAALEELRQSVAAEIAGRRPAVQMSDIHPQMSASDKETVAQEIARVLRGDNV